MLSFLLNHQESLLSLLSYVSAIYVLPPNLATKLNVIGELLKLGAQVLDKLASSPAGLRLNEQTE